MKKRHDDSFTALNITHSKPFGFRASVIDRRRNENTRQQILCRGEEILKEIVSRRRLNKSLSFKKQRRLIPGFSQLIWAVTPACMTWRRSWKPGGIDYLLFLTTCPTGVVSSCGASTTTKVHVMFDSKLKCLHFSTHAWRPLGWGPLKYKYKLTLHTHTY